MPIKTFSENFKYLRSFFLELHQNKEFAKNTSVSTQCLLRKNHTNYERKSYFKSAIKMISTVVRNDFQQLLLFNQNILKIFVKHFGLLINHHQGNLKFRSDSVLIIDGWKTEAANTNTKNVACLLHSATGEAFFLVSFDLTGIRETGEELADIIEKCLKLALD
ncbi:hypothetical protein ACI65C_013681 [Semiaphis heraclei]